MKLTPSSHVAFRELHAWLGDRLNGFAELSLNEWEMHRDRIDRVLRELADVKKRKPKTGPKGGRVKIHLPLREVWELVQSGIPKAEVARRYGVSRPTLYSALQEWEQFRKVFGG